MKGNYNFHGSREQLMNALHEMLNRETSPQKQAILQAAIEAISELDTLLANKPA